MNHDKLPKFMDFMMNAYENTIVLLSGVIALIFLIIWVYLLLLMEKYEKSSFFKIVFNIIVY